MNRRLFLASLVATGSGMVVPGPMRVYSFAGGWQDRFLCSLHVHDARGKLVRTERRWRTRDELEFTTPFGVWRWGTESWWYPALPTPEGGA